MYSKYPWTDMLPDLPESSKSTLIWSQPNSSGEELRYKLYEKRRIFPGRVPFRENLGMKTAYVDDNILLTN